MKSTSSVRWKLAWYLFLPLTFIMSLDRTVMTISAPVIQKEMGFSLSEMSWILTAFHWSYAVLSIPAGLFAAWLGARVALLIANTVWSMLTLAVPFIGSATPLIFSRLLLGGFQAVDWPSSIASFKRWFPTLERSRANSALLAGVYLGPILGAPLTSLIVSHYTWRTAFIVFGLLGIASAIAWWVFFRNTPAEHPAVSQEERDYIQAGMLEDAGASQKGSLNALLGRRAFWTIGLQGLCTGGVMGFFNTWLPTYLMQERGIQMKSLGYFSSLPWIALLLVVSLASVLADHLLKKTGSVWLARVPTAIFGFIVAASCLLLSTTTYDTWSAIALLSVALGGMGFVQVSTWATIQEVGGENTGVLTAWNGMLTNGGAAIGPMLMARMVQNGGSWGAAIVTAAIIGLVGAVAWTVIHPRNKRVTVQTV